MAMAGHKRGAKPFFSAQDFGLQERVLKMYFYSLSLVLWLGKRRTAPHEVLLSPQ